MNLSTWPDRLLVVDIEGNGTTPPDLVELAAIPIVDGRVRPKQAESTLIRPPRPFTAFATRVHRITNYNVQTAPAWEAIADKVQADLDGAWIAAHNAHIDYGVLARHLPTWKPAGVLDTLRLARAVLPSLPKHGLDALITHTGIDMSGVPGQRHRAAFDAHATVLLLNLAASFATWDDLVAAVPPRLPGVPTPAPDTEEPTLW